MQNPCRDTCTHGHTQPPPHLWPRIPFHLCMHQMSRHHQDVRCIAYIYIGIPTNTATTTNNNSKKKHKSSSNSSNIELSKWWNNTLCRTTLPALCAVVAARCTGCAGCAGGGPRARVQVRCNTNVAGSARAVRPRWTRGRGGTGGPGWTEESRHVARAPLQEEVVRPAVAPKKPATQGAHQGDAASLYFPAGQMEVVALVDPARQAYPAVHAPAHADEFIAVVLPYRPPGHAQHTPTAASL